MDKFWEFLPQQLEKVGFGWLGYVINILVVTGVGPAVWKLGNWSYKQYQAAQKRKKEQFAEERRLEILKDLHPYYSKSLVKRSYELFIETQGQNVPPSRDQEPGRKHAFVNRAPLIPQFINCAFESPGADERFFGVLAGSGMVKTTFMINLYLRYIEETQGNELEIKLFPLGYPGVLEDIRVIVTNREDRNTILLLDAFDEDAEAARDHVARLDEIVHLAKNFREVIITSRTQFFPNEEAIPGEIKVPKPDTDRPGFHRFKVMYLSPFDDKDIEEYLTKKFSEEEETKRDRAREIVKRSPRLMVRPMLLANIDDLLKHPDRTYQHTHEIYEALVDSWIERESGSKPSEKREIFGKELLRFSKAFARLIFDCWQNEERLFATPEELRTLAEQHTINLTTLDMRSRSLLNRDAEGNVKFSHKSIWEYFVAVEAYKDEELLSYMRNFEGIDMVKHFLQEYGLIFPEMIQVEGGSFQMGSENGRDNEKPVHTVTLSTFEMGKYPVTVEQFQAFIQDTGYQTDADKKGGINIWTGSDVQKKAGVNWTCDVKGNPRPVEEYQHPVIHVSWNDAQVFCEWISKKTRKSYTLPTEAQWEFAARGGNQSNGYKYAGSNDLDEVGWYRKNSGNKTHPVGQLRPNELGIYDMSGNVWEWCQDWYGDYSAGPLKDPLGPESGQGRVGRGGGWGDSASGCRVADRSNAAPSRRFNYLGFRLSRPVP